MYAVTLCHDGCEIWRRHWTTNLRVAALVAFHDASLLTTDLGQKTKEQQKLCRVCAEVPVQDM